MNLSKQQLDTLKIAVSNYERWVKKEIEFKQQGQELLNKVKTCSGSTGANWSLVQLDVDAIYAQAFRELEA